MHESSGVRVCLSVVGSLLVVWVLSGSAPAAQRPAAVHLNPVVEKFAQGEAVIGVSTVDFSLDNASAIARSGIDFVRLDMEHGPQDVTVARQFLVGMIDRAAAVSKGNAQPNVAPFVRIAPYGREGSDWVVKQMLDIGMMGIKFPTVDNKEQALAAIRSMRYPQLKSSPYMEPAGLRGMGSGIAVWFWGVTGGEYARHADLWPLNPDGDLLAIILVESAEGLRNIDEIASVPGVGVIFAGVSGDMPRSLGVSPDSPEIGAARQRILDACLTHDVVCGLPVNAANIEQRITEGWRYLDVGRAGAGLTPGADAAMRVGRAVLP